MRPKQESVRHPGTLARAGHGDAVLAAAMERAVKVGGRGGQEQQLGRCAHTFLPLTQNSNLSRHKRRQGGRECDALAPFSGQ